MYPHYFEISIKRLKIILKIVMEKSLNSLRIPITLYRVDDTYIYVNRNEMNKTKTKKY